MRVNFCRKIILFFFNLKKKPINIYVLEKTIYLIRDLFFYYFYSPLEEIQDFH